MPFAALPTRAADVPKAAARPNVLLIISDDQGYSDFGFTGNAVVKTPHLDRLAAESAVFRNFVVAAACSPSRAAIFTGREHLGTGVWGVPPRANLRRDEVLAPAFFRRTGYRAHRHQLWRHGTPGREHSSGNHHGHCSRRRQACYHQRHRADPGRRRKVGMNHSHTLTLTQES